KAEKAVEKANNTYEAMFLFGPAAASDAEGAVNTAKGIIERHGGAILVIKKWDERKLSYEIKGQKRGTYVIAFFTAPGGAVTLLGNLTRDPQLKYLPSQTAVVEFGMAMNRKFKTQSGEMKEEVTFIDCSAFGRTAEVINQYCHKGNLLFVEGRLKYATWEDKQ